MITIFVSLALSVLFLSPTNYLHAHAHGLHRGFNTLTLKQRPSVLAMVKLIDVAHFGNIGGGMNGV